MKSLLPLVFLIASVVGSSSGPIIRETGAIYLEEAAPDLDVKLRVLEPVAIFSDLRGTTHLGVLSQGQQVELQAVSPTLYRVRGRARQGQVVGWVQPRFLEPLAPDFTENLRKMEQRRKEVLTLIAEKEIATGFTMAEVQQSLGKPQKRSSRVNESSSTDIWEYITYRYVPQQVQALDQFGRLVWQTMNVKVPSGRRSVVFTEGVVTEISEDEETTNRPGVRIVPGPIEVY
jgi:hypothetical protein